MSILLSVIEKYIFSRFPSMLHPFLKNIFIDKGYLSRKTGNLLLNHLETKMKKQYLVSYPYYLYIDPTNICNLRCPLCPTWQDLKARPKGKMNIQTFQKLLDEVGPYLFAVNLCNWGEPLLNPELPVMVRYAKHFNTVVGLSTNLNYLPDETAKELIESGIDIIVISLDGTTQESYSKYRREGNLSAVLANIEKLNSFRANNKNFPLLIWQFLVNKYNELEIDMAQDMAKKLGLMFLPSPMRTSMGKELLLPLYERVKEMKDWLPLNPAYNKYAYDIRPDTRTRQTTCKWLWNASVINWDGSVSPCCGVFEKTWDFATCNDTSGATFHKAWNSQRYRLARQLVTAFVKKSEGLGALLSKAEHEGLICSKCIKYGFLED